MFLSSASPLSYPFSEEQQLFFPILIFLHSLLSVFLPIPPLPPLHCLFRLAPLLFFVSHTLLSPYRLLSFPLLSSIPHPPMSSTTSFLPYDNSSPPLNPLSTQAVFVGVCTWMPTSSTVLHGTLVHRSLVSRSQPL